MKAERSLQLRAPRRLSQKKTIRRFNMAALTNEDLDDYREDWWQTAAERRRQREEDEEETRRLMLQLERRLGLIPIGSASAKPDDFFTDDDDFEIATDHLPQAISIL